MKRRPVAARQRICYGTSVGRTISEATQARRKAGIPQRSGKVSLGTHVELHSLHLWLFCSAAGGSLSMSSQHTRILMVEDSADDAELIERELRRGNIDFSLRRVGNE